MGRSGLGDGGAKSTTDLAPRTLLSLPGCEEPRDQREYGTAATPSSSPAARGGDEEGASACNGDEGGRRDSSGGAWRHGGGRGPRGGGSGAEACGEHRAEKADQSLQRAREMEWERFFFWEDVLNVSLLIYIYIYRTYIYIHKQINEK